MNRKNQIKNKLMESLNPQYIDVIDESGFHNVPENAQTHFKVTAVSNYFEGMTLIKRHRIVNNLLAEEFKTGLHALSLHLKTPTEWDKKPTSPKSPTCRDGFKHG